ncbi:hypothetical protein PSR1_00151 [Anaeromyxobacter sp. PSR-1]|nr:hypothetical protein PSR1_00151 [Anaeromyxobacter sp. PSR-1]
MSAVVHRFVDQVPEDLEDGVVYVSIPFSTVIHKCCCGCGHEVVTPLSPHGWQLIFDGQSVSLHPSIGNRALPCRSHYWIKNNRVHWAGWYEDAGAKKTGKRRAKARAFIDREDASTDRDVHTEQSAGSSSPLRVRLRRWLHKD